MRKEGSRSWRVGMVKQTDKMVPGRKGRRTNPEEEMDQPPKVTDQAGKEPQNPGIPFLVPESSGCKRRHRGS